MSGSADRSLGMQSRISRRDFLDAALLAAGSTLAAGASPLDLLAADDATYDGYGGIGDYAGANGDTWAVVERGHRIRDGVYARIRERDILDAGTVDVAVIGGGISGLAAALFVSRQSDGTKTCLVLDDHPAAGGLARRNEFDVGGHRLVGSQASAMYFPPLPGTFLDGFYRSIGIDRHTFDYQPWVPGRDELPVGRTFYFGGGPSSAFYFGPAFGQRDGLLLKDPWGARLAGAPIDEQTRGELLAMAENRGARAGALPATHGDEASRRLDAISLEQHLMDLHGLRRETVRRFLSPVTGGGSGLGADALSAYADYAADVLLPWEYEKGSQMFPGGNTGVARHILKGMVPEAIPGPVTMEAICRGRLNRRALDRRGAPVRVRPDCTAIAVEHEGPAASALHVRVVYVHRERLYRVRARAAVMAGGSWTTKHIVRDLPDTHRAAYAQFHRSPCLVANVAVRHWRFLYDQGLHECRWFEGIGNYVAVRRVATFGPVAPAISPDSPVVLTLKIVFSYPGEPLAAQVARGRAELLQTPFREYERRIREHLTAMFGRHGFDARRDVAAIILNRWGHAYLSPQPGFFFGTAGSPAPGEVLRRGPFGRIAFANSDLTGIMDHRTSILEAKRAAEQLEPLV